MADFGVLSRLSWSNRRRGVLLIALALLALGAGVGGALAAHRASSTASDCVAYGTGPVPAGARCMDLPWQLVSVGPRSRSLWLRNADGCFASPSGESVFPDVVIHETRSTIRIDVTSGGRPVSRHGRLDTSCYQSERVQLHAAVDGRRIEGQSWPSHLGFGGLRGGVVGLPRLLGLAPAQAAHLLWVLGFRARVSGSGKEIVAQTPGWGLTGARGRPVGLRDRAATLTAGNQIVVPTPALPTAGAPTGLLIGRLSFTSRPRAEPVAVFDSWGRLLARVREPGQGTFRLRLRSGCYFLLPYDVSWINASPPPVKVRTGQITRTTIPGDGDYPSVSNGY